MIADSLVPVATTSNRADIQFDRCHHKVTKLGAYWLRQLRNHKIQLSDTFWINPTFSRATSIWLI